MARHQDAHRGSAALCDYLMAQLGQRIEHLERGEKSRCSFRQRGNIIFAWVDHGKRKPQLNIWCLGEAEELIANTALDLQPCQRDTEGGWESFPVHVVIGTNEEVNQVVDLLVRVSYAYSTGQRVFGLPDPPDYLTRTVAQDIGNLRTEEAHVEGARSTVLTNRFERDPRLRANAIRLHGTRCQVCDFSFQEAYGPLGEWFIEVHHLKPISTYMQATEVNPWTDMAVLCANCHRMVHRKAQHPLSLDDLRRIISANRRTNC